MTSSKILNYKGKNYQLTFSDDRVYRITTSSGREVDLRGDTGKRLLTAYKESSGGLVPR